MNNKISNKVKVSIEVDLGAEAAGFCSAKAPTEAHVRIMKHYSSPLLVGPPTSEDLLELMAHMFTEDEADLVQHLPPVRPRTAAKVAKRASQGVAEVERVLDHLVDVKRIVLSVGSPRRYTILPIVPGTFEMTMMRPELTGFTSWHKRFAEIFERLWETGFVKDYVKVRPAPVRYIPAIGSADTLTMAWPSERLEEILDRYDKFALGHCQCRITTRLNDQGCDKPTDNCLWIGPLADMVLDRNLMREVSRQEAIDCKKEAEQNGCVTWMMNEFGDARGNVSCSCCGCCCHGMRTINEFSAPGLIAKPNFLPARDKDACNVCGKCALACPMGAWKKTGAQVFFEQARCVGCGLCVINCKANALALAPVAKAKPPSKSLALVLAKGAPDYFMNALRLWLKRMV